MVRRTLLSLLVLGGWAVLSGNALAVETIETFDVALQINKDASASVVERIVYDFGDEQRHGIFRTIPIEYRARGGTYKLRVSDISVVDDEGRAYQYTVSTPGRNLELKIGDADAFVTGRHVYVIGYTVERAVNYFSSHDEVYWNATGTGWPVAIKQASATVAMPAGVNEVEAHCFAGAAGSDVSCAEIERDQDGGVLRAMFAHSALGPGEGLTVVVGLPKGAVYEPTARERLIAVAADNWVVIVPLLTLGVLWYMWWTRGRDPSGRGTIVTQYDPPDGLSPSQVGTIVDETAHNADITADIIQLATQGYVHITRVEKKQLLGTKVDYTLQKLRDEESLADEFERTLLQKLFADKDEVSLSDLKNTFYKHLNTIREQIYESVAAGGYFVRRPDRVRQAYLVVGLLVAAAGAAAGGIFMGAIAAVSLGLSGILIAGFSWIMPVKTKKGALMKEYILGLKRYLSVAEKARLKFHNAPEKNPERFDLLLPYAMVLGVEKEWADQFKDVYREPPDWYTGPAGTRFNAALLASNMGDFSTSAKSALASRPSSAASGGSGFSGGGVGGGFGGGGGGSW